MFQVQFRSYFRRLRGKRVVEKIEVYSEAENDAGDAGDTYPCNATAGISGQEHDPPGYNMQMVRHIEEKEDEDRGDLIDMGGFKPTSGNATKRLRM